MAAKRYRERNCDFCGRLFWPKSPSSKTCSAECQRARRTAAKKKLVIARRDELTSPANRPLTYEEELAHEALLEGYPDLTSEDKVRLRSRDPLTKRTDIRVGMLHPFDLLPDGKQRPSVMRAEVQGWVTT